MKKLAATFAIIVLGSLSSAASAELVLSQTIVDLLPDKPAREDIEVLNAGAERMYVLAEPFEIVGAGSPQERREPADLSRESSVLVSPMRMVLEPGERRTIRIGFVGNRPLSDKVYRVSIRPVAGKLSADASALKVYVGYDALVLVRPANVTSEIRAERTGRSLELHNIGNTSQEVFDGRQCQHDGSACKALPPYRLYPGATWKQELPYDAPVEYKTAVAGSVIQRRY